MKKLVLSFLVILLLVTSTQFAPATAATKYDFKNVNWGMTVNQVKKKEKSKILETVKSKDFTYLVYKTKGFRKNANLYYLFYKNKLVRAMYVFDPNNTNGTTMDLIGEYFSLKRDLFDTYDRSINNRDILNRSGKRVTMYEGEEKDLAAGKISYQSYWIVDKKKTHISLSLSIFGNFLINRVIYSDNSLDFDIDEVMDSM
ncbi:hypothetical protein [Paenibacillus amylolyticus]|uniref:hypothetical protein n=1 Tax=Paenibacillus amylolyticus TaxID=1451 RepID=UPI003D95A42C